MSDEGIYSSREKFIEKGNRSKYFKYTDSVNKKRRSSNSGFRRLKHILKNCLEDKLGYLLNKFLIRNAKRYQRFWGD